MMSNSSRKRGLHWIASHEALSDEVSPLREMTLSILFLDIRGYTTHVESTTPKTGFRMLSAIFDALVLEVEQHGGVVDKFMGDALMALFEGRSSADRAVEAAVAMQQRLDAFNARPRARQFRAGIGINTGPVIVGHRWVGGLRGKHLSVVGDAVNLAARLETLTKSFGSRILISHHTHAALRSQLKAVREVDTLRVRGRQRLVNVYEVFATDSPALQEVKRSTQMLLFQGMALYKAWLFEEALLPFRECLEQFPEDPVTINYIKRCNYFREHPPEGAHSEEVLCEAEERFFNARSSRAERYNVQVPVQYEERRSTLKQAEAWEGQLLDLSRSGARVKSDHALPVGVTVRMTIFWEQGRPVIPNLAPLEVTGTTIWNRSQEGRGEFGIEFLYVAPEEQVLLNQILDFFAKQTLWD